jgi:hypothetical protein
MIEVSNELTGSVDGCPNSSLENPPYKPAMDGDHLQTRKHCMTAENAVLTQYNLHSLYGYSEARSSMKYQVMTLVTMNQFALHGWTSRPHSNHRSHSILYASFQSTLQLHPSPCTTVQYHPINYTCSTYNSAFACPARTAINKVIVTQILPHTKIFKTPKLPIFISVPT